MGSTRHYQLRRRQMRNGVERQRHGEVTSEEWEKKQEEQGETLAEGMQVSRVAGGE